jgi:hypothetical protein
MTDTLQIYNALGNHIIILAHGRIVVISRGTIVSSKYLHASFYHPEIGS